MKTLSIETAYKINAELINRHFNPSLIDYLNDNGEWVCTIVFNVTPDVTGFLKELAKQGNFNARMELDKFDDTYSYSAGDDYILRQYIPDNEWEKQGELNLLKDLFRNKYALTEKIAVS